MRRGTTVPAALIRRVRPAARTTLANVGEVNVALTPMICAGRRGLTRDHSQGWSNERGADGAGGLLLAFALVLAKGEDSGIRVVHTLDAIASILK